MVMTKNLEKEGDFIRYGSEGVMEGGAFALVCDRQTGSVWWRLWTWYTF